MYATLLDAGTYLSSVPTMYRLLHASGLTALTAGDDVLRVLLGEPGSGQEPRLDTSRAGDGQPVLVAEVTPANVAYLALAEGSEAIEVRVYRA